MTTIKEFAEHLLKNFPHEAEVKVIRTKDRSFGYESCTDVSFEPFDSERDVELADFRDNQFVKPGHPYFGRVIVRIGETNS